MLRYKTELRFWKGLLLDGPLLNSKWILFCRYSPYGRRATEDNIPWDRLRAAPVDTPSHKLHVSDCLHDLKPGDHIEIQWRRNKEFPYGVFPKSHLQSWLNFILEFEFYWNSSVGCLMVHDVLNVHCMPILVFKNFHYFVDKYKNNLDFFYVF